MKGELVILRAYGGQPLVRRIVEITDKAVYVKDDSRKDDLISIGFPKKDVFKYNPVLATSMERLYKQGKWDWSKLVPY